MFLPLHQPPPAQHDLDLLGGAHDVTALAAVARRDELLDGNFERVPFRHGGEPIGEHVGGILQRRELRAIGELDRARQLAIVVDTAQRPSHRFVPVVGTSKHEHDEAANEGRLLMLRVTLRGQLSMLLILLNVLVSLVPRPCTTVMIATEIPAADQTVFDRGCAIFIAKEALKQSAHVWLPFGNPRAERYIPRSKKG